MFPMWQNKWESPRLANMYRINFFINKAKGTAPNHFDSRAVPFIVIVAVSEEQIDVWSFFQPEQIAHFADGHGCSFLFISHPVPSH